MQTVKLAMAMKLASLGHVSLDGSKFKANSSRHKAMTYKSLKEKEQTLCAEVEALVQQANTCDAEEDAAYQDRTGYELPADLAFKQQRLKTIKAAKTALEAREEALHPGEPIDAKKQISFADTEARIMGKKGDFDYRYNGQISVDSDHQVITGQPQDCASSRTLYVSQNANDKQEVQEGLDSIAQSTGQLPEKMSLDNGYQSGSNLAALEQAGVDAYVAVDRGEKSHSEPLADSTRALCKADFSYDEPADCFHCPGGQRLVLKYEGKDGNRCYQAEAAVCGRCPYYARCCKSRQGAGRTITTDGHEGLRRSMTKRMEQADSKAIYKRRKVIVEPVFGHIKNGGFRRFSVRGKDKVAGEFSLVCAAHNMKKMVRAIMTGSVCPEFGNTSYQWG